MYVPSRNSACRIFSLGNVECERRPEPLHEVHGARVGSRDAQRIVDGAGLEQSHFLCAPPVRRRHCPQERAGYRPAQIRIARHPQP